MTQHQDNTRSGTLDAWAKIYLPTALLSVIQSRFAEAQAAVHSICSDKYFCDQQRTTRTYGWPGDRSRIFRVTSRHANHWTIVPAWRHCTLHYIVRRYDSTIPLSMEYKPLRFHQLHAAMSQLQWSNVCGFKSSDGRRTNLWPVGTNGQWKVTFGGQTWDWNSFRTITDLGPVARTLVNRVKNA